MTGRFFLIAKQEIRTLNLARTVVQGTAFGIGGTTGVMYRIPLVFTPQREGGYTVTSPVLPELHTEGDSLEEAQANVHDAMEAVVELYAEQKRSLPASILLPAAGEVVWTETLVGSP